MDNKKIIPSIALAIGLSSPIVSSYANDTSSNVNNTLGDTFENVEVKGVGTLYNVEGRVNQAILSVAISVGEQVDKIVPENMSIRAKRDDDGDVYLNIGYTFKF